MKTRAKLKPLVIESSSVEFGSAFNLADRALHFLVTINDIGMEPEQEYKVRFTIQNNNLSDLIETKKIEVPETYKTIPGKWTGLVTGSLVEITKEFTVDEIRKIIEKDKAVIVELYNDNGTITQEVITTFEERIFPKGKINPEAKFEYIDIKEINDIALFSKALSEFEESNFVYPYKSYVYVQS